MLLLNKVRNPKKKKKKSLLAPVPKLKYYIGMLMWVFKFQIISNLKCDYIFQKFVFLSSQYIIKVLIIALQVSYKL